MSYLRNYYDQIAHPSSGIETGDIIGLQTQLDLKVNNSENYSYCYIWAEEAGPLADGQHQWSYGNGNTTPDGMGIIISTPNCELISLSLAVRFPSTCTVEARINNSSTGKSVSTSSSTVATVNFENDPVPYSVGDVLNFRTVIGDVASASGIIVAGLRILN